MNKEFINRTPMPEGSDNPANENGFSPAEFFAQKKTEPLKTSPLPVLSGAKKPSTEELRASLKAKMSQTDDQAEQERLYFQILELNTTSQSEATSAQPISEPESKADHSAREQALHGADILANIFSQNNVSPEISEALASVASTPSPKAHDLSPIENNNLANKPIDDMPPTLTPEMAERANNDVAEEQGHVMKLIRENLDITPELLDELSRTSEQQLDQRIADAESLGDNIEKNKLVAMKLLKSSGYKLGREEDLASYINQVNQNNAEANNPIRLEPALDQNGQPLIHDEKPVIQVINSETGQNQGQLTYETEGHANKVKAENQAGYSPPEGLSGDEFREWIEDTIRNQEDEEEGFQPENIAELRKAINSYRPTTPIPRAELSHIVELMEIRGALSVINFAFINTYDYKTAGQMITAYLNEDRLKALFNSRISGGYLISERGAPAGSPMIMNEILSIMDQSETGKGLNEEDPGAYWREKVKKDKLTDLYPEGTKHRQLQDHLASIGVDLEDAEVYTAVAEKLTRALGMAAYYTGPRNFETGRLVETEIILRTSTDPNVPGMPAELMTKVNADFAPELTVLKNENYWNEWLNWRKYARKHYDDPRRLEDPDLGSTKEEIFMNGRDATTRLIYFPEELERTDTAGKARSLRHAAELYVRPLPLVNGRFTVSAYLSDLSAGKIANSWPWHRYGGQISNGGELRGALGTFVDEPITGGVRAWNLKELNNNLKNVAEAAAKMDFLKNGISENLRGYAVEKLLGEFFKYLDGDSYDRLKEFNSVPHSNIEVRNMIVNLPFFTKLTTSLNRRRALSDVGAGDGVVNTIKFVKNLSGWFKDQLKLLFKMLNIGK